MAQNRQVSSYLPHQTVTFRYSDVHSDLEFLEEV